jgi:hypothetical protein
MEPTIVSTSTGAIAIAFDYSPYLERIATSLETIAYYSSLTNAALEISADNSNEITSAVQAIEAMGPAFSAIADLGPSIEILAAAAVELAPPLQDLVVAATTTGIKTDPAYSWIAPVEMASWYGQGFGVTRDVDPNSTAALVQAIDDLVAVVPKFKE